MKSALRKLFNQSTSPVPYAAPGRYSIPTMAGRNDNETYERTFGVNGTVHSIVTLMARSSAKANWRMYRVNKDNRVRYSSEDIGSDQRVEVLKHKALDVFHTPNDFMSRYDLIYLTQQWLELCGEAYWMVVKVPDTPDGIPIALWPVNPSKITPVPHPTNFLAGYVYGGPSGEKIPLRVDEILQIKYHNPMDLYHGLGPVQAVLVDIDAAKYTAEWNRNFFLNGAEPGGIVQIPNNMTDEELNELSARWRESHQGVNRAHRVAYLEAGATWVPNIITQKDMEFGNLRQLSREVIREAWGVHKIMLGNSDDVNRANAQTGEEIHSAWQVVPRLDLIRNVLNKRFLPMFKSMGLGTDVEFDYHGITPIDAEQAAKELLLKSQATNFLVTSGYEPHNVLEVVGLPDMGWAPPPSSARASGGPGEAQSDGGGGGENGWAERPPVTTNRLALPQAKKDVAGRVFEQVAEDYPVDSMGWVHYADWMGPVNVPLAHLDMSGSADWNCPPENVQHFEDEIDKKGKTKPVILVKTPSSDKLCIIDGHTRVMAYQECGESVRAFVGAVDADEGPWDEMHDQQMKNRWGLFPDDLAARLRKMLSNGHVEVDVEALR